MLQKLKKRIKNQRGMTLVELLAVIVILGIISAIAVPNISKVVDNSRNKAKIAEAIQIIDAAKLAHAENESQIQWTSTSTSSDLTNYISKVKDTSYTVNYNALTKTYSITGHEAAPVVNENYDDSIAITEDQLANKAR